MNEERILFKGSSSPVLILPVLLVGGVLLVASVIGGILFPPIWIATPLIALFMVVRWLFVKFRVYELTSERIRVTEGILTRKTEELELYRVQDLSFIETFIARMFNVGTIRLITMDTSNPHMEIQYIRGARQVREDLRKSIEVCRDRKRVRVAEFE